MRFITGLACTPRIEFDITWHCKGQWYRCGINMTDSTWRSCVYICHTFYVIIIVFSFVHKEVFIPNTNISAYHIHSPDMLASWHGNTLQWHHNERDGVAHHQPQDCLRNCIFRCRSKKTSKILVTGLCEGNSPVTGEFPHTGPVTRKMFPFDDVVTNFRVTAREIHWSQRELICSVCC